MTIDDRLQKLNMTPELWAQLMSHVDQNLIDPGVLPRLVDHFLQKQGCSADPEEVLTLVREVLAARFDAAMGKSQTVFSDWSMGG